MPRRKIDTSKIYGLITTLIKILKRRVEAQKRIPRKCEVCGVAMKTHPVCEACKILCGPSHLESLTDDYRGHKMCYHCSVDWQLRDGIVGRETTWEEFLNPVPVRKRLNSCHQEGAQELEDTEEELETEVKGGFKIMIRKERFCDLMVEKKVDSMGNRPETTEQCKNPAKDKCFFCKRDYCQEHASSSFHQISLKLTGFKVDFVKVLPRCKLCEADYLPYNPEDYVLKRYERLWSAIKRTIRAEQKAQREKQRAKVAKAAEAKAAKTEVVKQ